MGTIPKQNHVFQGDLRGTSVLEWGKTWALSEEKLVPRVGVLGPRVGEELVPRVGTSVLEWGTI